MTGRLAAASVIATCSLMLSSGLVAAEDPGRAHVEFLASEALEGRQTGTPGERKAAEYIAGQLRYLGARPLPGRETMLLPFEIAVATEDAGSSLVLMPGGDGARAKHQGARMVRALGLSADGAAEGEVVFAGYGLTIPEGREADLSYDSYAGLDVEGKIVLALDDAPADVDADERSNLMRHAGPREKARRARELGAAALLLVRGPHSPEAGKTLALTPEARLAGPGFVAASIAGKLAERIVSHVDRTNLAEIQASLDTGNPHVTGFAIPDLHLKIDVRVARETRTGHNVAGYLPGETGAVESAQPPGPVVLGAHFDHLGRGDSPAGHGQVLPGADDNASGVAALLAIGARLAAKPGFRPVILAFWSGKESGLAGSTAFLDQGHVPADGIAAYVGFDRVGRMREKMLLVQAAGSSPVWPRLIEQTGIVVEMDVRSLEDPHLPTDSAVFYRAGVPSVSFSTGTRAEHRGPMDRAATLDYDGLGQVVRFATVFTGKLRALREPPEYVEIESRRPGRGDRDGARAFTGTIPDYAGEVDGLRLSGVVPGGPAEAAGLREGDVIVEFAERQVANAYDYMHALEAVKIDVPVRVVFLRDGERMETIVTPAARK